MFSKKMALTKEEKKKVAGLINQIEVILDSSRQSDFTKYCALKLYSDHYKKALNIEDISFEYQKT